MTANLAENITGVRVVSAFNRRTKNLSRYNELQDANTVNNLKAANINGLYQPLIEFLGFAGQVIVLAYGSVLVLYDRQQVVQGSLAETDALTAGQVIQVYFYWGYFMRPTITMGNFYNTLMQTMALGRAHIRPAGPKNRGLKTSPMLLRSPPAERPYRLRQRHLRLRSRAAGLHGVQLEIPAGKNLRAGRRHGFGQIEHALAIGAVLRNSRPERSRSMAWTSATPPCAACISRWAWSCR